MQLHNLSERTNRTRSPRVGRGGKRGKTSGRGGKGQTARAGAKMRPEMRDLIKKLPKRRGHGVNRSRTVRINRLKFVPVNVRSLETAFKAGETVSPTTLLAKGIIQTSGGKPPAVKILGTGTLTKKLTVTGCKTSASAKTLIEAMGGKVE